MTPEDVWYALRERPGLVWLDDPDGRSILAWEPAEVVDRAADWPAALRALSRRGPVLGYAGYESGDATDRVPAGRPTPEPAVWFGRYRGVLVHQGGAWTPRGEPGFVTEAAALLASVTPAPPLPDRPAQRPSSDHTVDRSAWLRGVEQIRAWLHAGDCYQVNLTRPVFLPVAPDPIDTWRRLRRHPAPYGAFLAPVPGIAVLSNSPELLLRVDGRALRSDPIKGTRPRHPDALADASAAEELRTSEKEQAELMMIVDLVRNDLTRVARPGTVRAQVRELHSHPTVHHAHWPVTAELGAERDAVDALVALFPPGSVTGAPKIRATERIRELEEHPRGVYCGAIGHVLAPDDATFSVAIRVAVCAHGAARWHVGGGIVLGSDPAAEWEETVVKERAMRAAFL